MTDYKNYCTFFVALMCMCWGQTLASTYYVSSSLGADSNSGTSSLEPWQSLDQVNGAVILAGDSILFRRGDVWRGQLLPASGNSTSDVYYGAYSTGELPLILGSVSLTETAHWADQGGNIWKANMIFGTDIGNMIFDDESSVGTKQWNFADVLNQGDFWYDLATGEVFLYSGVNPADFYTNIELALREEIVHQTNVSYVTYEHLALKYGAAHGFGGGNTQNITIRSCQMSYIGGGDLNMDGSNIRYGNGVEFWGNASNNVVERCEIWEIYDTGVTNQNHTSIATQENLFYRNNLIWNCGLSSFEYWNRPVGSVTSNIRFENNTCLYAGKGWGAQRPDYHGIHVLIDSNPASTDTIHIYNNIFYDAQRSTYAVEDDINGVVDLDHNLIYQENSTDTLFVSFPSYLVYTYANFSDYTAALGVDLNSITDQPQFEDLGAEDFRLTSESPCINEGKDVGIVEDFDGVNRPQHGAYDIGAYEYDGPLSIAEVGVETEMKIYPNPTNGLINLVLAEGDDSGKVLVLDLNGKSVHTGTLNKQIDLSHLPNGHYTLILMPTNSDTRLAHFEILR